MAFHRLLAQMSQNSLLITLLTALSDLTGSLISDFRLRTLAAGDEQEINAYHRALVHALSSGDEQQALHYLHRHMDFSEQLLLSDQTSNKK